jgi:hypothetical protein
MPRVREREAAAFEPTRDLDDRRQQQAELDARRCTGEVMGLRIEHERTDARRVATDEVHDGGRGVEHAVGRGATRGDLSVARAPHAAREQHLDRIHVEAAPQRLRRDASAACESQPPHEDRERALAGGEPERGLREVETLEHRLEVAPQMHGDAALSGRGRREGIVVVVRIRDTVRRHRVVGQRVEAELEFVGAALERAPGAPRGVARVGAGDQLADLPAVAGVQQRLDAAMRQRRGILRAHERWDREVVGRRPREVPPTLAAQAAFDLGEPGREVWSAVRHGARIMR